MEFLIWMAIGVSLMAVELVVPGGILGLIGYCAFLWGVYVALGEGTVALYAVLGLTALLIVIIIVFFNHFEKTWIGKLFTLGQRSTTKAGYISNDVLEDLAGKEGVAPVSDTHLDVYKRQPLQSKIKKPSTGQCLLI